MPDCIFCRIVSGEIPATVVARTPHAVAFRDLNPQAPTHILVIPTEHVATIADLAGDPGERTLGSVMGMAAEVARQVGLAGPGFRLVVNAGADGGQTVGHLHVHLLGGRQMTWPPG